MFTLPDPPLREVAVAVLIRNGEVLVGVRPTGVPLAGYAEFPGGKVDDGESPAETAVRECAEETGLVVEVVRRLNETFHQYEHARLHLQFFQCELVKNDDPIHPFHWVSLSDLGNCTFPPANESVLDVLRAEFRTRSE